MQNHTVGREIVRKLWIWAIAGTLSVQAFDGQYSAYKEFLSEFVCREGVAYSKIKSEDLQDVRKELSGLDRTEFESLDTSEQIAYLINLYNFYTIDLIVRNLPLKNGIRDIDKPWKREFVPLFDEEVSLDHIEHDILRKEYEEPRIHFALVCASLSCPALVNRPFVGRRLDEQLTGSAKAFLDDRKRNRIKGNKLFLSKIFKWYGDDFNDKYGGPVQYIKETLELTGTYKVSYLEYDWSLNEVESCRNVVPDVLSK